LRPILRQVTPRSVAVFVAFKSAGEVELHLGQAGAGEPFAVTSQLTHALGQNLHVPIPGFLRNEQPPLRARQ
jgi:hypothetical protein